MKHVLLIIFITITGCSEHPKLPISNTLEIALRNRYSQYVKQLNEAYNHDSSALVDFLKINYINDAAGYDHGFIIFQLMKKHGDKKFSDALRNLTDKELSFVFQYFEVGIDANDNYRVVPDVRAAASGTANKRRSVNGLH